MWEEFFYDFGIKYKDVIGIYRYFKVFEFIKVSMLFVIICGCCFWYEVIDNWLIWWGVCF